MTPTLSDADLHCLVDGHLDTTRRVDVLRRLAKSPEDRARVESWQDQTDLLRAAFGTVEREPLPATLDCSPKPRLRCVSNESGLILAEPRPKPRRWRLMVGGMIAILASAGILLFLESPHALNASLSDFRLRGSVDEALRARSVAALGEPSKARDGLPTLSIPDLQTAGFTFVGAETQLSQPASLLFRYLNAASETLVITVARGASASSRPSTQDGGVYLWRSRDNTFAIAGTIKPERLRAIATALQADDPL